MSIDWETCELTECVGVRAPGAPMCIAHGGDPALLDSVARQLDFRGVTLGAGLWAEILDRVPYDEGKPTLTGARFDRAVFTDGAPCILRHPDGGPTMDRIQPQVQS